MRCVQTIQGQLDDCCVHFYHDISKMGERLKAAGMNPGEKSRVSNFEHNFYQAYLIMRSIKDYRTPQGLRAFARMYIMILPIMFGMIVSVFKRGFCSSFIDFFALCNTQGPTMHWLQAQPI